MNNYPFSHRLNNFILRWWTNNASSFQMYDKPQFDLNDAQATFEYFKEHWRLYKTIPMWNDGSECNIFGCPNINAMFRAWHDYMHVVTDNNFTLEGEIRTFNVQKRMIPKHWKLEKLLMQAEIVGQGIWYTFSNKTIPNQRTFALDYISTIV